MTGSGRRRTLRFGLLLLLLSLIPAQFALASDDSVTGQLDPALDQCGEATFGPPQIPPTNWVDGVVAYADGCSGAAFQGGFDIAAMQANRAGWEANAALRDSQSTANATVLTAAGIVTAAVNELSGQKLLKTDASIFGPDATCLTTQPTNSIGCQARVLMSQSEDSSTASTSGMTFVGSAKIPMGYRYVDGIYTFEMYWSQKDTTPWRVWATTVHGSIRGVNGGKITQIKGTIQPNREYIEALNWSPKSVSNQTSGSIQLCLAPSIRGVSAGSICITWDRTAGQTGGYMTSTERHEAVWKGSATATARGIDGVQTWKVPRAKNVSYKIVGWAWYVR